MRPLVAVGLCDVLAPALYASYVLLGFYYVERLSDYVGQFHLG